MQLDSSVNTLIASRFAENRESIQAASLAEEDIKHQEEGTYSVVMLMEAVLASSHNAR